MYYTFFFKSILFERNIFQFHFILEKSQSVILYTNLDIIFVFQILQYFIHTHILKKTCETYYVFQKLFRVFYSDVMFFNVALY